MAELDPDPEGADMRAVAKNPRDLAAADRLSKNVRLNAQLRTTCVATLIAGGHAGLLDAVQLSGRRRACGSCTRACSWVSSGARPSASAIRVAASESLPDG
jgi:hypothetical protein